MKVLRFQPKGERRIREFAFLRARRRTLRFLAFTLGKGLPAWTRQQLAEDYIRLYDYS